jgi:hypothetical protein
MEKRTIDLSKVDLDGLDDANRDIEKSSAAGGELPR